MMNHEAFVQALDAVAGELLRRADACAVEDTMEPCNLILSNAATACLIALNVLSGRKVGSMIEGGPASIEATAAPRIACGVPTGAVLS